MTEIERYAVAIGKGRYLMAIDGDGRETIPLFLSRKDANEAAERADLDAWTIVSVILEQE